MDRGAWPFFADGVTCLVISVSVCEEERKRRERMKEKRRENERENEEIEVKKCFFKKFEEPQTRQMK